MNRLLLLPGVALLTGCATAPAGLTAIGAKDATGARTGDYRVVSGPNLTVAQGSFVHGRKDGRWRYFDSHGAKVIELTYHNGAISGPYQTYFGSILNPAAAGKLESEGRMENGRVTGRHVGYDPASKVFTDAVFNVDGFRRATVGTREQAEQTATSDEQFATGEEKLLRSTLQ